MNDLIRLDPDTLFESCRTVKAGAVREVRTDGKIFIKLDKRKHHSFAREFNRGLELTACGIPTVRPLFFTASEKGSYLATEAFNGIALEDYLKNNIPDEKFFLDAASLLKKMLSCGFLHTDFHLGNLLYSPESGKFALVDVEGIRKIPRCLIPLMPRHISFHLLTEFRSLLNKEQLLQLFRFAGMSKPENFYAAIFSRNAAFIRHSWPRRRQQILSAYRKFTFLQDGKLIDSDLEDLPGTIQWHDNGKALFLAHFYLKLIRMPHRMAAAFDPATGKVALLPGKTDRPDESITREMIQRMNFYGVKTDINDWQQSNGLPELSALEKVAALPFICEGK